MSSNNENEKMNNSNAEKKFTKVTARDNKKRCKSHIEYDVVRFGVDYIIGTTSVISHKHWVSCDFIRGVVLQFKSYKDKIWRVYTATYYKSVYKLSSKVKYRDININQLGRCMPALI